MNTINDELIYKVHVLHSALNEAQKNINVLEKENSFLKETINNFYEGCSDSYKPEITGINL